MTNCEVVTLEGVDSVLNRKRRELNRREYYGFTVHQFVEEVATGRVARIFRFIDAEGTPAADIRYWRENPMSGNRKLLKQVPLFGEEDANYVACEDPRNKEDEDE